MKNNHREHWNSRSSFIFAAIGSAVGLGNLWRFPGQAFQNGGGTFLVAYLVAILTAGVPLLTLELAIGRKFQAAAPSAMGRMNKRFEWIGWLGVIASFIVVTYYMVILGWASDFFVHSFSLKWLGDVDYFKNNVLQQTASPGELGSFNPLLCLLVAVLWVIVWFCLRKGIKTVGLIAKITVITPLALLAALLIHGLTLPGAMDGIRYYITPDWNKLWDVNLWAAAYGQVFVSMSILMSVMIVYGSFLGKKSNLIGDALIIGGGDAAISFFSGFVIFTTLGYLSTITGTPIGDMEYQGIMLVFVTYPQAIAAFPGGQVVTVLFSLCFFLMLLTLGIDSAFSMVETVTHSLTDKFGLSPKRTLIGVCLAGGVISLFFTSGAGLYWLDIIDHHINNFLLLLIGIAECIAVGWMFGTAPIREHLNLYAKPKFGRWWDVMIRYFCPAIFILIGISFVISNIVTPYMGFDYQYLIIGGWLAVALALAAGISLQQAKGKPLPAADKGED